MNRIHSYLPTILCHLNGLWEHHCLRKLNYNVRIVSNKYVPFKELINTSTNQQEYGIKVRNNVSGALTLTRATPDEAKVSRNQWVTAFYIFTAIMTEQIPKLTPGLMKYGSIITGMADRGMDWRYMMRNFANLITKL